MSTAQHQNVRVAGPILKDVVHIYMSDLFGDAMLHPSFFHQRYKKGASFFCSFQSLPLKSALIGVLCHRADGFRTIRKMRGVSEIKIVYRWQCIAQFTEHSQASKPGVKNSNHRWHAYSNSFASSCMAAVR